MSKDVITAGAAVYAASIATKGLTTWQRQFRGQQDFALARQIALAVAKYQSAIDGVRNPLIWFEMKDRPVKLSDAEKARFDGIAVEYKKRWDAVVTERDILESAILEARVVWKNGAELLPLWSTLFELEKELRRSVYNYLTSINPEALATVKFAAEKAQGKARDILYDVLEADQPDSYRSEVAEASSKIVEWLAPKLMR
ncbi:hypothetical protein [Pseudoduganella sp. RAF53_2]|uniref:hypothetical protein n=1 Tax=unclassified Pseudoduganella TaxID=2637179 RepID=UPI003F9A1675